MPQVKAMSAQYTQISLTEMDQFLKRGFRSLRPKRIDVRGEVAFELYLNDESTVAIRVLTSIPRGSEYAAAEGADAIRVGFFTSKKGHPLIPGKQPIVKRTQGWRDNLKDRIEDYMELYSEKEAYWDSRAGLPGVVKGKMPESTLTFQVTVDPTLPSSCSEAVSFDTGDSKREVGSGVFAYSQPEGALLRFYEDLMLGAPFPFRLNLHAVRGVGTVVATMLFLSRDLALLPGTHALVAGADFYHRVGSSALGHLPQDLVTLFGSIDGQFPPGLSQEEVGQRLAASVHLLREYLVEDILPHPGAKVEPKILTTGSNGFVVAEVSGKPNLAAWVALCRQGYLRGLLIGPEREGTWSVMLMKKSDFLPFDLVKGALLLNELEALHEGLSEWKVEGLTLTSPKVGTRLSPSIVLEVAIRL